MTGTNPPAAADAAGAAGAGLGRLGVWSHLDSLSMPDARAFAARADELGYDALWVPETVGREPFAFLGLLTGSVPRMRLGTSIVSIWGHDAQATRMAAETLHEATDGRFVLGLGVSHAHLAQRLRGHAYERPLAHMRAYLAAYRAALYRGPAAAGAGPLVLVAALREHMLDLSARDADGAFPYLVTPERVAWMRQRLDAATGERRALLAVTVAVRAARDRGAAREAARAYLAPYLRTPNYQASWAAQGFAEEDWAKPGSDRLIDAMVAWGTAEAIGARLEAMRAAGADHVALIPLDAAGVTDDLATLEALAGA